MCVFCIIPIESTQKIPHGDRPAKLQWNFPCPGLKNDVKYASSNLDLNRLLGTVPDAFLVVLTQKFERSIVR